MNGVHRWLCRSAYWKAALERRLLPWALEGVDLGDDLLEVGPGPGLTTDMLRLRVARMTAVEIDPRLAESLKRRMAGTNVRVIEADATDMPLEDGMFSAAVSLTMLHHVPSASLQDKLLAEMRRTLRPGGVLAGIDSTSSLSFRLLHIGDTMVVADPGAFGARLEAAGFSDVQVAQSGRRFRFQARRGPQ